MSRFTFLAIVIFYLCATYESQATTPPARVVSASFYDIGDANGGPLHSTTYAGVPASQYSVPTPIQVQNWNNLPLQFLSVPGSTLDLYDSLGVFTTVDVDWIATDVITGAWGPRQQGIPGIQSGDSTLMNGAIQSTIQAPTNKITVNVRDVGSSFDVAQGYDVILYADQDGTGGRQSLFVDDGITAGRAITMLDVVAMGPPRAFDPALDYDEGTTDGAGTWMRFSGLTGSSFTIEALAIGSSPAFLNGFQIVGYQPPGRPNADLDGDGIVTGADFTVWQRSHSTGNQGVAQLAAWQSQYGGPAPLFAATQAVPEPASVGLALIGLIGLACRRGPQ